MGFEGNWADGETLKSRTVYRWTLGKTLLHSQVFVTVHGTETQRYEGFLYWNPEKNSLCEVRFNQDGSKTEYVLTTNGLDQLQIGWTPFDASKPNKNRSTIHFLNDSSFEWTVETKDGDSWKQLIKGTRTRSKK